MTEVFDPYRKMIERPGFAKSVSLAHSLMRLVKQQQYGEGFFQRDFDEDELLVVHGLATAYAEVRCARFDLPDAGRITESNPRAKCSKVTFRPYNSLELDERTLPSPETAIF